VAGRFFAQGITHPDNLPLLYSPLFSSGRLRSYGQTTQAFHRIRSDRRCVQRGLEETKRSQKQWTVQCMVGDRGWPLRPHGQAIRGVEMAVGISGRQAIRQADITHMRACSERFRFPCVIRVGERGGRRKRRWGLTSLRSPRRDRAGRGARGGDVGEGGWGCRRGGWRVGFEVARELDKHEEVLLEHVRRRRRVPPACE